MKPNKVLSRIRFSFLLSSIVVGPLLPSGALGQAGPPTNNLQLWLKADAGVTTNASGGVTSWADQSPNQFTAAPATSSNAPTYIPASGMNPTAAIRFDLSHFLQLGSTLDLTNNVSGFAVINLDSDPGAYRGIIDQGHGAESLPAPLQWMIDSSGGGRVQRGAGVDITTSPFGYPTNWDFFVSSQPVPIQQYVVLGFTSSNNASTQILDGSPIGSYTFQCQEAALRVPMFIGARYPSGSPLNGQIAELLLYDSSLDPSGVASAWGYLKSKYGLTYAPPTATITSPTTGSTFAAPVTVIVKANATAAATSTPAVPPSVAIDVNGVTVATLNSPPYTVPIEFANPGTAVVTAVVTDGYGLTGTSAPVSLTLTGAAAFTPTSNLQLWLQADAGVQTNSDGTVNAWLDQTANHNDATVGGASPPPLIPNAINGLPAIDFNGTNSDISIAYEYLTVANSASLDITGDIASLVVVKESAGAANDYRMVWWEGGNQGYPSPNGLLLTPGGAPFIGRGDGGTAPYDAFVGGNNLPPGNFGLISFTQTGATMSQFLNGAPNGVGTSSTTYSDGDGGPLYLGTRGDLYNFIPSSDIQIAELMIFNTALTGTNLDYVQNYLATKYGIILASQGPNQPPTVAITSPADGGTISVPANLTVTVSANDADGAVANVQLFLNGSPLATQTTAPYQFTAQITTPGKIVLTAVATDNQGATSTNATVTITGAGGSFPASPFASGLQLWLKADAGVTADSSGAVTNWADQSGNGNTATQLNGDANAPTLITNEVNGLPALRFEGSPVYMSVNPSTNLTLAGDVTSFAVIRIDDYSVRHGLWSQTDSSDIAGPNDWSIMPSGDMRPRVNRGDGTDTSSAHQFTWYGQPLKFQPSVAPGQFFVLGWEAEGLTTMIHYFNNETNSFQNYASLIVPTDLGNPLLIGTRGDLSSEQLKGDMAELLIYDRALSSSEVATVQNYLAGRYGIVFANTVQSGPSVAILTPTNGASLTAPANFDVTATANASVGNSITNVQLLVNGVSFGGLSSPPYHWPVFLSGAGTITLQVTATDNTGQSNSATSTVNPVTYSASTNLVLWLRADTGVTTTGNGSVTSWTDQSTYGNNAVAGTTLDGTAAANPPVLIPNAVNGQPAIHFNESSSAVEYLQVANSASLEITGDIASLVVLKEPADAASGYRMVWFQGGGQGNPSPNGLMLAPGGQPAPLRGDGTNSDVYYGNSNLTPGTYGIISFSQSGATMTQYLNGLTNGTQQSTMAYSDGEGNSLLYIGTRKDFYSLKDADLEIAELMIFNTALTDADLTNVNAYLSAKYNTVVSPGQYPSVSIVRQGGSVVLSWPASYVGYTLQGASSPTGVWAPVGGAQANQATITPSQSQQYYRLVSP